MCRYALIVIIHIYSFMGITLLLTFLARDCCILLIGCYVTGIRWRKKSAKFTDIKQVTSVVLLVYLVIGIVLKIKLLRHNNKVLTFMLDKKNKKYLKANTSSWQKRYLMIIYMSQKSILKFEQMNYLCDKILLSIQKDIQCHIRLSICCNFYKLHCSYCYSFVRKSFPRIL